jgi:hypothetical protein
MPSVDTDEVRIEHTPTGVDIGIGGALIARYALTSEVSRVDLPKPHFHPLHTRGGVAITGFAPEDHPWHHGLQFAFPRVDGHNLWGGGTFHDLERGYTVIDDHGSMVHVGWEDATDGRLRERVCWRGSGGEDLIDERRQWTITPVSVDDTDGYALELDTELHGLTGEDVALSTPAGRGRPDGGYGGLFLRLGEHFSAEGLHGEDGEITASGSESRTLVVHGRTGEGAAVTLGLSFLDPRAPGTQAWLYRFDPFSAIGWASAYNADLVLPADAPLHFRHRLLVLDGHVDPAAVRAAL